MIRVTQGHENGIGLEVFLKSYLSLDRKSKSNFILYCNKETFDKNLKILNISKDQLQLKVIYQKTSNLSQTLNSITTATIDMHQDDILLTLPSSKDQFVSDNMNFSGHTEYFRHLYKNSNIVMSFISKRLNVLLLTDHISLERVGSSITKSLIISKVKTFLEEIKPIRTIKNLYFSGINPHCGENGLIGTEDKVLTESIKLLKIPQSIKGPLAGDTLFFESNTSSDLFIYASHDQGLTVFKQYNGLQGINLTLGLPFIRVSPDHGTAPNIFGKNEANYLGMNYLLNEILKWGNKKTPHSRG